MNELLKLIEKCNCEISIGKWNTRSMEEMEKTYFKIQELREKYLDNDETLSYSEMFQIVDKISFVYDYIVARKEQSIVRRIDDLGRLPISRKIRRLLGNGNCELTGQEFDINVIYDEKRKQFGFEIFLRE